MTLRDVVGQGLAWALRVVNRCPPWFRPILIGAGIGLAGLGVGAFNFIVALPYVIVQMLRGQMTTSSGDLRSLGEMAVLYVGGFTLAGVVYSLIGRQLRRVPRVGNFAAAAVSLFPCMLIIGRGVDHEDGTPLLAPLTRGDVGMAVVMSAFCGGALVYGAWHARRRRTAAPSA